MRGIQVTRVGAVLALLAAPLVVTALYASHLVFDVQLKANVTLSFSNADPLKVFSGDGVTPLASGDAIDFGTAEVDVWGTVATRPKKGRRQEHLQHPGAGDCDRRRWQRHRSGVRRYDGRSESGPWKTRSSWNRAD